MIKGSYEPDSLSSEKLCQFDIYMYFYQIHLMFAYSKFLLSSIFGSCCIDDFFYTLSFYLSANAFIIHKIMKLRESYKHFVYIVSLITFAAYK